MNREQYEELQTWQPAQMVTYSGLRHTGTLLYGYDLDRHTWHVYGLDEEIHLLVTTHNHRIVHHKHAPGMRMVDLIPNKRTYPESTHKNFAMLLRGGGFNVPYLPFDDRRYEAVKNLTFHGLVRTKCGVLINDQLTTGEKKK